MLSIFIKAALNNSMAISAKKLPMIICSRIPTILKNSMDTPKNKL
jgi:hypothetical protein